MTIDTNLRIDDLEVAPFQPFCSMRLCTLLTIEGETSPEMSFRFSRAAGESAA